MFRVLYVCLVGDSYFERFTTLLNLATVSIHWSGKWDFFDILDFFSTLCTVKKAYQKLYGIYFKVIILNTMIEICFCLKNEASAFYYWSSFETHCLSISYEITIRQDMAQVDWHTETNLKVIHRFKVKKDNASHFWLRNLKCMMEIELLSWSFP